MDDERLVAKLAKRAFAADVDQPVAAVDAVIADPRLSLAAAGVSELLERRWAPIVRAVLGGLRDADLAAIIRLKRRRGRVVRRPAVARGKPGGGRAGG